MTQPVLVVGGTGHVGRPLCRGLQESLPHLEWADAVVYLRDLTVAAR